MRQIHPVAYHEKFVASGMYQHGYVGDDKPLGIVERWTIHQLPDASYLIRSDWDARDEFGESRLVEVLRSSLPTGSKVERFDVHRYLNFANAANAYPEVVRATYVFLDDGVQIVRQIGNNPFQHSEIRFANPPSVNPGVNADQRFILELADQKSRIASVFHPNFDLVASAALAANLIDCSATILDADILTDFGSPIAAQHYQLSCGDGNHTDYWFDEHGTVLRFQKGEMAASLVQYARRPEPLRT